MGSVSRSLQRTVDQPSPYSMCGLLYIPYSFEQPGLDCSAHLQGRIEVSEQVYREMVDVMSKRGIVFGGMDIPEFYLYTHSNCIGNET
jgi:hypothetical protein